MEKTLEELRLEADALGLTYPKTIGAAKLQEKIDAFYDAESTANTAPVAVKEEVVVKKGAGKDIKEILRELEVENMKTVIVKVAMVDRREASTATHAYFSTGDVSMNIPLDIFVEMPKILVKLAEESKAVVHVDSNGSTSPKLQKRYVVEYK